MNEFNRPEDYVQQLVDTMNENCHIVEELALEAINSWHIPLLNSLCLTNEDCEIILNKCYQQPQNLLEMSTILIVLTDFLSCVSANFETFPLVDNKKSKKKILLLMQMLLRNWSNLFRKLPSDDVNINRISNIIVVLKRCLERIPSDANYKKFMESILKKAIQTLDELLKSSKQVYHKEEQSEDKHHNARNVTKAKPEVKQPIQNKKKMKKSHDITKFILKPCENLMKQESVAQTEKNHKRKFLEIERNQSQGYDEQNSMKTELFVKEIASPASQKHCVHDDFINGKINAFKMLMKRTTEKPQNS